MRVTVIRPAVRSLLVIIGSGRMSSPNFFAAAAFLEFHELLAAWLHPYSTSDSDTLLTSDAIYNNYVRVDVVAKILARPENA